MACFRPGFHQSLASTFVDDIYYGRTTGYFFLGKITPWDEFVDTNYQLPDGSTTSVEFGDTTNPHKDPGPEYFHETTIRNNIVYIHQVGADNVCLVTKGHKWVSGTYYTQWDQTKNLDDLSDQQPYYVYNDQYQVYKCLYNNKAIKADGTYEQPPSTYQPSGVSYDVIETPDGYLWKYMYTIQLSQRSKFANNRYIPVTRSVQNQFYSRGTIEDIIVTNGGSGYSSEPKVIGIVGAPTNGTQAEITLHVDPQTGSIDDVTITNRGSGYTSDPSITVQDSTKRGTGKYNNNSSAILTAHVINGQLDTVSIVDCGINYPADTATTIAITGDGTGAAGYPLIVNGSIVGVKITNSGVGYTYADVTAQCSYDAIDIVPAEFKTTIGGEIVTNDQSVVEQLATPGQIYAIEVTNGGSDYTSTTTVTITGDGSGCTAHPVIVNGRVAQVKVDTCGSGYTYANVTFNDPNRREPNPNPSASAYAILPPMHGHGYNAIEELNGHTVAIYLSIRSDAMLSNIVQEFRQFGMITDLRDVTSRSLSTTTEELVTFDVTVDNPTTASGNIGPDSDVMIQSTKYRIVKIDNNQIILQQLSSVYRQINVGDSIVYVDPITQKQYRYIVTIVNKSPVVDKYSGILQYTANNTPFYMEDNKTFGLKTYITM